MVPSRQLKTKIRAVGNIQQITKAMELVSATKMRKSQEVALRARPYAKKAFSLLTHILEHTSTEGLVGRLWQAKAGTVPASGVVSTEERERIALVVVTSDKGLCGNFNSAVLKAAMKWKEEQESPPAGGGKSVEVVAVGRKGRDFFRSRGVEATKEFFQFSDIITLADIAPLADWILEVYEKEEFDRVVFCSTRFISVLSQKPNVQQILPLEREELEKIVEGIVPKSGRYSDWLVGHSLGEERVAGDIPYVLEPSAQIILEELVRELVRVAIVHLVFESNASEHSARMMAMKNATDNAEELIENLNLALNKSRQAAITQELSEISTAKEALTSE